MQDLVSDIWKINWQVWMPFKLTLIGIEKKH